MAKTWNAGSAFLSARFDQTQVEGPAPPVSYEIRSSQSKFELLVSGVSEPATTLPIDVVMGGNRHGLSFLARVNDLGGIPLARSTLVEARYAYSPRTSSLVLSPGFQKEKPLSLETALGRVLSPTFEQKCLRCHGQPGTLGSGVSGGVHCESCHGPSASHVANSQSIRPNSLAGPRSIAVCAQCHTGLNTLNHADPVPGDLIVSSQVPALQHSECFRQTGGHITCTDCHNPHRDASSAEIAAQSSKVCLTCHASTNPQHASVCPVNTAANCSTCHMPSVQVNGFSVADHWIGVRPDPSGKTIDMNPSFRSRVTPKREYLEIIATDDQKKAEAGLGRIAAGDSFYDVARSASNDPTASAGGFLGDMQLADMDADLAAAAARLWYGESSGILQQGNRYLVLHRLPRDFKWQANRLFLQAVTLRMAGDRKAAMLKAREALKIYPLFLRAHIFMGVQLREMGDLARAQYALAFATQSFPSDAFAQFQYALTLKDQPKSEIDALRRVIELEPDIVGAYENLGIALASSGDKSAAIEALRRGLIVDPLSAALNFQLATALKLQGDENSAKSLFALAAKLDARH